MLNQYQVPVYIAGKMPEIRNDLSKTVAPVTIYQSIQVLTDYTKRMAIEHNFSMVKKCMALVETIYEKGNTLVKNAVENVFVYSFSSLIGFCNIVEWRIMQSYMPYGLYTLYLQQVLRSKD
jgi:hypothetical protein